MFTQFLTLILNDDFKKIPMATRNNAHRVLTCDN
jgi:hypothetical protein